MKKIFRMALVIALAGASLLYTGCTKDVSADINKVANDLANYEAEINAKVNDLEGKISSLNSAIASLTDAYQKADAALQKAIDANASDIKALQADVDGIKADITALQGKVKANEEAIAAIKADLANYATKKELADAQTALEEKINAAVAAAENANKELETALLAKIDAMQTVINEAKTAIQANADAIADLQAAQEAVNAAAEVLANELRSIVFVPELYYAGIEATEYLYAYLYAIDFYVTASDYYSIDYNYDYEFTIPKGVKAEVIFAGDMAESWEEYMAALDEAVLSIGSEGHAFYNLNPSTFDIANAEFKLNGYDKEYVIKGEETEPVAADTWAPVLKGIVNNAGVADVTYTIENPAFMNGLFETVYRSYYEFTKKNSDSDNYLVAADPDAEAMEESYLREEIASYKAMLSQIKGVVSIMNLEANIDGKVIASDYEAIVGTGEFIDHLAFSSKNAYKTHWCFSGAERFDDCNICADLWANDEEHYAKCLYWSGANAAYYEPSVPVYYNGGGINLAELLTIHVYQDMLVEGAEYEATIDELNAIYGDALTWEFELMPWTNGYWETSEDAYGIIEGEMFYPAYVNSSKNGEWTNAKCGTDGKGVSAIGRMPVVLATLMYGDQPVAAGYFKIIITEEDVVVNPEDQIVDLADFGEFPLICDEQYGMTTWHEFSANILESLGVKYETFLQKYQIYTSRGLTPIEPYADMIAKVFVKNAEGKMVEPKKSLGQIIYSVDGFSNSVNDVFVWDFTYEEMTNWADPQVVYICFEDAFGNKVYFSFTASAAAPADVTYGDINPAYWFDEVKNETLNTVRVNVRVPNVTDDDVLDYSKDLDDNFIGNQLKLKLAEASKEVYGEMWEDMETSFAYKFSAEQPKFDGKKLVINDDADSLYVGSIKDENLLATLTEDGVIKYATTDIAKKFLNKYGHLDIYAEDGVTVDQNKLLYANVTVSATYGDCEIEVPSTFDFHARFLRPVDITKNNDAELVDALPTGDNVEIGKMFNAVDWQGYKIFGWNATSKKYEACWYGNVINWYEYYGFTTMKIDFENVKTDQTGKWELLSEVNTAAKLYLAEVDGETYTEVTSAEADITNVENLAKYVIHYENNMGVVKDFHFSVPVQIVYSWGTISFEAEILVHETYTPKN